MTRTRLAAPAVAVLLAAAVGGCTGESDAAVRSVVTDFHAALAAGDSATACALLAPETRTELEQSSGAPCEEALPEEDLGEPGDEITVQRYGDGAQARLDGDVVFLGHFGDGWRITAAGCAVRADRPHQCSVKGG